MPEQASDEVFATYVAYNRLATPEQIEAARRAQEVAAGLGIPLRLGEVLVRMGILTTAQWTNVQKKLRVQPSVGVTKLGPYRLIRKIGLGAMGEVYHAEDTLAQRQVALKVLSPELAADADFLARFRREAVAAGKLNHVNLVTAFAFGEDQGRYFYVMELCPGEPLDRVLRRERMLPCAKAVRIAQDIAQGLQYAHARGFIHRDVKPANVMITPEGQARLLDMGLARLITQTDDTAGRAVGTPHYISPEQARGLDAQVDGRTDLYSLGALLFHMLAGRPPYEAESSDAVMRKHLTEPVPSPRDYRKDISDALARVVRKMMAKAPDERYKDCAELLADLEHLTPRP